jgi:hypothetical protein
VSNVSAAKAPAGGKVDGPVGEVHQDVRPQRDTMTALTATATRARTGGPETDGPKLLEHVMGWVLVAVVAMLVTRLGLL